MDKVKEIQIFLKDGGTMFFVENRHTLEFNGEWMIVKSGYNYTQVVFVASARNVKFIAVC